MRKILLLCLLFTLSLPSTVLAEQRIYCGRHDIVYNEDGTISVWRYENETVYDSLDDFFMEKYGFIPSRTLGESGYADLTSWNRDSSSNNSSSHKQRGRLIYTIQEANEVAKDGTTNKVRLRYK